MKKATQDAIRSSTVFSQSIDWLTVTAKDDERASTLWDLGNRLCDASGHEQEPTTRWHAHGYVGFSGSHWSFGQRLDGVCLRLSGPKSSEHWLEALTAAENCSRIDLAVDTQFDPVMPSLVQQLYVKSSHTVVHGGRPPMRRLVADTNGGATCYFGSRASERFARVYDKGVESKTQPKGRWFRWELEAKDGWARALAAGMLAAERPAIALRATVAAFFRRRAGVHIPGSGGVEIYNLPPETPSDLKLLHWLSTGVRPTVQRLTAIYGRERVLTALGIPPKSAVDVLKRSQGPEAAH